MWENYVEQLAIDVSSRLSAQGNPKLVPAEIVKILEKKSAWELTITPGWQAIWAMHVEDRATGGETDKYGMNTARWGAVTNLLAISGLPPSVTESIRPTLIPPHLSPKIESVADAVNALVELRGEIAHTAKIPPTLSKHHIVEWSKFVADITSVIDSNARSACKKLL